MTPFTRCPKCGHQPLPQDQSLPAACPACGVILAKVAQARQGVAAHGPAPRAAALPQERTFTDAEAPPADTLASLLLPAPARLERLQWGGRALLLAFFCVWGVQLIAMDYRTGAMGESFIHRPLLVFHEAGHVIFRPLGEWLMMLGGTLGQLLMPAVLAGALLLKNRDPFGAAIGLWLLGVSVMDVAPYMFDALDPQLMLLSGTTGAEGGHDWIYLFSSMGLLQQSPFIGGLTHKFGALLTLLALAWAAWVLRRQWGPADPAAPARRH